MIDEQNEKMVSLRRTASLRSAKMALRAPCIQALSADSVELSWTLEDPDTPLPVRLSLSLLATRARARAALARAQLELQVQRTGADPAAPGERTWHTIFVDGEAGAGARQSRHHCPDRDAQHLGGLGIGKVFDPDQQKHGAVVLRQGREGPEDIALIYAVLLGGALGSARTP